MEIVRRWLKQLMDFLDITLFRIGETEMTIWTLLYLLVVVFLLFYLSAKMRKWLVEKILPKTGMGFGARQALGTIIRYFVVALGILIILQTAGINLTTLQVIAGTVGIGVGFGLQNIASNFVSGLIILFERPITIGDRIEVGNVEGDVLEINARSTTVVTNDNIAIIIPNSKFITENVVNWSLTGSDVRFRIPVAVAYGSDLKKVVALLEESARDNPDVLENPPPAVRFLAFGDNGLLLELRVWSTTLTHRKATLISALNFAINDAFQAHGIEMPFPQRDIRVRQT
ncbi:MAG TPA: mechanosensitive ion channel domain-containing protein [Geobacteraceae bacterium]